ncbi:hypothetical protein OUZ56_027955 [Daphnia magna]|uniref:Uncharacterized protein n=1 Tax=Daphnia magna TaxID=35525 RepID=A0ABR0B2F1_9CRUS|nr:hypothetical protein OUZ56_027955 [Daphnia magna]
MSHVQTSQYGTHICCRWNFASRYGLLLFPSLKHYLKPQQLNVRLLTPTSTLDVQVPETR